MTASRQASGDFSVDNARFIPDVVRRECAPAGARTAASLEERGEMDASADPDLFPTWSPAFGAAIRPYLNAIADSATGSIIVHLRGKSG